MDLYVQEDSFVTRNGSAGTQLSCYGRCRDRGAGEYKNYFLDGLAVTGPAAVILTVVLISYLAVYFARSKNNPK